MIDFFFTYGSLLDLILVNALLAMSQYVVLRAGVRQVRSRQDEVSGDRSVCAPLRAEPARVRR